jgi:hypothetical protein
VPVLSCGRQGFVGIFALVPSAVGTFVVAKEKSFKKEELLQLPKIFPYS